MRVTWYGHSCFLLEMADARVLIDPFLTGNGAAPVHASDVACTHILCSHAHEDHLGDTLEIAKQNNATVVAPYELAMYLEAQGLQVEDPMPGGTVQFRFGTVSLTPALHTSALEQQNGHTIPMGAPVGFIVSAAGRRIYHAGDTALFSDMVLLSRPALDLALLPIGGYYTMDAADAVRALDYLCPRLAVPMHYGTNSKIQVDPRQFQTLAAEAGHRVQVLKPGESIEL
jgi:L-ascorbate metabolism protein UlaG (beta-lactamase superfamily)